MRIGVIGTGYVGLVSAACFAELGHDVVAVDIDEDKVRRLRDGKVPIYEPGLTTLVESGLAAGRLRFTTNHAESATDAELVFIAVGAIVADLMSEGAAGLTGIALANGLVIAAMATATVALPLEA